MKQHVFKSFTTIILMVISLCFIQAYAFDPTLNLALGKTATARDVWDGDGGVYAASKAVDGNLTTSWMAAVDANGIGSWLYVDLQSYYLINKVTIVWSDGRWPRGEWKLQVATDVPDISGNSNWVDVYNGNAGSDVSSGTGIYTFSATAGRYVRMLGTTQSVSYGYHIIEMKVYSDCSISQGVAPSVAIFPSSKTLRVSEAYQYQSAILDATGAPMNVSYTPTWTIQDSPAGATIDATTGVFRATQTGTYTITCNTTYNSTSLSASATVTVIPFDATQNLALNKITSAGGGTSASAVDNNTGTMWQTDPIANEWWIVDLGAQYNLTNIELVWESAYAMQFDIYTSLTGSGSSDWTLSKSINRTLDSPNNYVESIPLVASARYVKFVDKKRALDYGAAIREFRVFGSGYYIAVAEPVLTSVTINPASVISGNTTQLVIVPKNQSDAIFNGATINVVVTNTDDSPTTGASIINNGDGTFAVNGVTQGTYKLTATATKDAITVTGSATLTVTEARRVATINLTTPLEITKCAANRAYNLSVSCVDQYGAAINPTIVWDIQGTAGGSVTNNKYTPANKGTGTVKATSLTSAGTVQSSPITFDVITDGVNVALNKPVSSISTATTGGSNAVDANIDSQWIVPDVTGANNVYDAWLIIDLQANYLIELVDVIWEGAYSKTYTVDYSTNGVTFATKYNGSNNGGTVTKYNQFYADPSTARYVRIHSTEAGSGYGTKILDVYIHGVDASVTNHFRTIGSGNWNDISTWETSTDNVNWASATVFPTTYANSIEIQNAHTVTLTENLKTSALTINGGGKLTLNSGKTLDATNINILSDPINGNGTYVDKGTTNIATATVQQNLSGGRNWYISSPVESAVSDIFNPTVNKLWSYDELNSLGNQWNQITGIDDSLDRMRGYITNLTTDGVITFTGGSLNTGNKSIILNRTENTQGSRGYNLVGNPYPSYLDWVAASAASTNLGTTMWYRTKPSGYVFATYNASGGEHTNGATQYIPPMQAFWVYVNAAGNGSSTTGTFSVTNEMRSHENGTNRLKAPKAKDSTHKVLRMQVSNGINDDETVVYFDANASNDFDNYDSPKKSNGNPVPDIYTVIGSQNLAINGMNRIIPEMELALGFKTGEANTYTLKATEINNFDTDTKILLKDNLLNKEQELTEGSVYSFNSGATSTTSRFTLIFKTNSVTTGVDNWNEERAISVYKNSNGQLAVNCAVNLLGKGAKVSVYNTVGQKLENKTLTSTSTILSKTYASGVYVVYVTANNKTTSRKVVIN